MQSDADVVVVDVIESALTDDCRAGKKTNKKQPNQQARRERGQRRQRVGDRGLRLGKLHPLLICCDMQFTCRGRDGEQERECERERVRGGLRLSSCFCVRLMGKTVFSRF